MKKINRKLILGTMFSALAINSFAIVPVNSDAEVRRDMVASMLDISPINPQAFDNRNELLNNTYALPKSTQAYIRNQRHLPKRIGHQPERLVVVDLCKLKWGAYDRWGKLLNRGHVSAGMHYCPDVKRRCTTPVGHFRVYRKVPMHYSSKYPLNRRPGQRGSAMKNAMFFKGGYAMHAGHGVDGRRHNSHGCIRMTYQDSGWLYNNFVGHGTRIVVLPYC